MQFDENFRQYGTEGYDLVFGHGFGVSGVLRAAPQFPRTIYITASENSTAKNVVGIEFAFKEASYLLEAFLVVAREVKSGNFKPRVISLGHTITPSDSL